MLKHILVIVFWLAVGPQVFASTDENFYGRLGLEKIHGEMPQFEFENEKAEILGAKNFDSQVLILHFWATWCEACLREIPQISRLEENMQGARMIALSVDNKKDFKKVKSFFKSAHVEMPTYILTAKPENKKFVAWGVPMTYFVSAKRNIFLRARGSRDWSKVSIDDLKKLSRLLK